MNHTPDACNRPRPAPWSVLSLPSARPKHRKPTPIASLAIIVVLAGFFFSTQVGCLGLMSNLMHAVGANRIPAQCDALQNSKVAVVTLTDQSQYSDDIAARLLTRKLREILLMEVKGVSLVHEDAVQQWRDTNGRDSTDYLRIGKDIQAEKVVAIELTDMRLRDGATLYRGRAGVVMRVFDVAEAKQVFKKELDEFTFPVNAGQYTSETTESKFRKLFLGMLANQIGRMFYAYDFADTVALDGSLASQ